MNSKIVLVLGSLAVCCLTTSAYAGPYMFTLPVEGVTEAHLPAVKKIFYARFKRRIQAVGVRGGVISFRAGGDSAKSLMRLGDVIAALKEAKLKVKPETWILKAQQIGVCPSVENAIGSQALKRIFESFEGAEVKVLGTVLLRSRMCVVLHLGAPVDYSAFETQLKKAGLKIDDLVWGHWKYGWGIEGKGHDHRHDTGVLLKPRKQP